MDGDCSEDSLSIDWNTEDEREIGISSGLGQADHGQQPPQNREDGDGVSKDNLDIDWNSEDEREIESFHFSPGLGLARELPHSREESSSRCPISFIIDDFVEMGFSRDMVIRAIKENGTENDEAILNSLLTYTAVESEAKEKEYTRRDPSSSRHYNNLVDDVSSEGSCSGEKEETNYLLEEKDRTVSTLVDMGYQAEEALKAIEICGIDSSFDVLSDFICAAQKAEEPDFHLSPERVVRSPLKRPIQTFKRHREHGKRTRDADYGGSHIRDPYTGFGVHKRKYQVNEMFKAKQQRPFVRRPWNLDDGVLHIPRPMIGFGVPSHPFSGSESERRLPKIAIGPPYFYFENVALTPKGVWNTISRFLYEIEPEFVDSNHFCVAARKRGYIHNLPVQNRFELLPVPPKTIDAAFPLTQEWWPSWDNRKQLNCLLTCVGSAPLTERIRNAVSGYDGEPPDRVKKYVIQQCKKWNLVWVGKNKAVPLEPDEMEMVMGFPRDHTRGCSQTDRYKALGNTFQVDTVGYHLSVLKNLYPNGINVLSLFSGIGGAEVALHKIGVRMKNVVSVELSEACRTVVERWWNQTDQEGNLYHMADVQDVTGEKLEEWIGLFGGFDLVIGGSPCNNFAGGNRVSRDGLEGRHSSLFFHFYRILEMVRSRMRRV